MASIFDGSIVLGTPHEGVIPCVFLQGVISTISFIIPWFWEASLWAL